MRHLPSVVTCALALLALTACTVSRPPLGNPETPYPLGRAPQVGEIVHLPTGTPVREEEMLAAATDARIVYVGETHDNPASHRLELLLLAAMNERWPGQVSLGMEMFTRKQQPALDRWTAGELSEKAFLKEADWATNWSMDFALYRDLLTYARDHRIPVIGLNAEKDLVKAVGRKAPAELSEEERARLPEMDLADPYQTAMVEAIYGGHAAGSNRLAGFHRVQTLWDEMMAESIANHLTTCLDGSRRMVVVAGGNHVRHGFGIPRRVFRRAPASYVLIGNQELAIPADKQDRLMNVEVPRFPMVPYDYLVFTAYEDLPGERVKLGVRMEEKDGRVVVQEVIAGSTADRAGVKNGDVLRALDNEPVTESFDVVYAVGLRKTGDKGILEVERDGGTLKLSLDFQPLPKMEGHKP
ncbi:MAG: PDZ domain-containing protein [Deltaproteobacteria bacterium]|nr:MAG: PDZ domain-containing protein [Deltaproteobacteria bacterium]